MIWLSVVLYVPVSFLAALETVALTAHVPVFTVTLDNLTSSGCVFLGMAWMLFYELCTRVHQASEREVTP